MDEHCRPLSKREEEEYIKKEIEMYGKETGHILSNVLEELRKEGKIPIPQKPKDDSQNSV